MKSMTNTDAISQRMTLLRVEEIVVKARKYIINTIRLEIPISSTTKSQLAVRATQKRKHNPKGRDATFAMGHVASRITPT